MLLFLLFAVVVVALPLTKLEVSRDDDLQEGHFNDHGNLEQGTFGLRSDSDQRRSSKTERLGQRSNPNSYLADITDVSSKGTVKRGVGSPKYEDSRLKQIIVNVNGNGKIEHINVFMNGSDNSRLIIENANANAEKVDKRLRENNKFLKKIVGILDHIIPDTAKNESDSCNDSSTITVTPQTTTTPSDTVLAQDCADLYLQGESSSGIYTFSLPDTQRELHVFCDMVTDGGGWTVFQRRGDFGNNPDFFARNWTDYKSGFGELDKEFWLGNDHLSALTQQKHYLLRVDLRDMEGKQAHAQYSFFKVDSEEELYGLSLAGYTGDAGDSMITLNALTNLNNMSFTTVDSDNDRWALKNCAHNYGHGGWWYNDCSQSNLNGLNLRGPSKDWSGIVWYQWRHSKDSLDATEMKFRPLDF